MVIGVHQDGHRYRKPAKQMDILSSALENGTKLVSLVLPRAYGLETGHLVSTNDLPNVSYKSPI